MRICIYTETALPLVGGQELVVDELARQFLGLGHEVVVLAARHRGNAVNRDEELPYTVVRHPRFISTHRFLPWYSRYIDRLRRQFPFDILHCHSVQPAGFVAACCRNQKDLRIVITSHCGDVCSASGTLAKPGAIERCHTSLRRADAVVAISEYVAQCLENLSPGISTLVRIPNGVNASQFALPARRTSRIDHRLRPGNFFLFMGRLAHRKGVDLLLKAFKHSSTHHHCCVAIAGDGPERDALRRLNTELGLENRVLFVGQVAGDEKTWLLQNAIAAVMPSRISEGFPLVALESFAAGRSVIASAIPGLREMVTHGRNGLSVTPDCSAALANALAGAVAAPARINQLGEAARGFARQHDWRSIACRYNALFERLLDQKPVLSQLHAPAA